MNRKSKKRIATAVGTSLFAFYIGWNVWWLSMLQVPPSILVSATGVPSPTTGGTRSFFALIHGDFWLSLHHNVATVPLIALLFATLWFVFRHGSAPEWVGKLWTRLLLFAFAAKILMWLAVAE